MSSESPMMATPLRLNVRCSTLIHLSGSVPRSVRRYSRERADAYHVACVKSVMHITDGLPPSRTGPNEICTRGV